MSDKRETDEEAGPGESLTTTQPQKKKQEGLYYFHCVYWGIILTLVLIAVAAGMVAHFVTKEQCSCHQDYEQWNWIEIQEYCDFQANKQDLCTRYESCSETDQRDVDSPAEVYTLPGNIYPLHYELELRPFIYSDKPDEYYIYGNVLISFMCTESTDTLVFNARKLQITQANLELIPEDNNTNHLVYSMVYDQKTELVTIGLLPGLVKEKRYSLRVKHFVAPVEQDNIGAYISTYTNNENETRYHVLALLEAPYAREVFPCFDEPALKATFNVTLLYKPPYTARSNGALLYTSPRENGWEAAHFGETPHMSTYLFSFLIGELECTDVQTQASVQMQICGPPQTAAKQVYTGLITSATVEWMENYTDVSINLSKLDSIGMNRFDYVALEVWGMIIYDQWWLFYEDERPTLHQYRIARQVAHEVAHNWFGNMVTCAWWDDILLNEAFATYFQNLAYEHVQPNWNRDITSAFDTLPLIHSDGESTAVAIHYNMSSWHPTTYNNIFHDAIYYKGAHILRMAERLLSYDVMQTAMREYLSTYKYQVATVDEMMDTFTRVARSHVQDEFTADIRRWMEPYLKQAGVPIIVVRKHLQLAGSDSSPQIILGISLKQNRFLINPKEEVNVESPYNYRWDIPVSYQTSDGETGTKWFAKEDESLRLTILPDWVVFNPRRTAWCRVHYAEQEHRQNIREQLQTNHRVFDTVTRAQLLDDMFSVARAGVYNVTETEAFTFIDYLREETDYLPWFTADYHISKIQERFSSTDNNGLMQKYMNMIIEKPYSGMSWRPEEGESLGKSLLRALLTKIACHYGHNRCVSEALQLMNNWRENGVKMHPDIREAVFCASIRKGSFTDWDYLYSKLSDAVVKDDILNGLACSTEYWVLQRYLSRALDPEDDLYEYKTTVLNSLVKNKHGLSLVWSHLREQWNRTTLGSQKLDALKTASGHLMSNLHLQEVTDLKNKYSTAEDADAFEKAWANIEENIEWYKTYYNKLSDWMNQRLE